MLCADPDANGVLQLLNRYIPLKSECCDQDKYVRTKLRMIKIENDVRAWAMSPIG